MLIVEGADCLGKTTLCKELVKRLGSTMPGIVYRHLSRLPFRWAYPGNYKRLIDRCVVQDRFHMSEIVYRAAREPQNGQLLGHEDYRLVDGWLRAAGAVTVIVTAKYDVLCSKFKAYKHADEMYDEAVVQTANRAYLNVSNGVGGFQGYRPDFDFMIRLDRSDDWPSERKAELDGIVQLYASRQLRISQVVAQVEASVRPRA